MGSLFKRLLLRRGYAKKMESGPFFGKEYDQAQRNPPGRTAQEQAELVQASVRDYLDNGWSVFPVSALEDRLTGEHRVLSGKLPTALRYYFRPFERSKAEDLSVFHGAGVGIEAGRRSNLVVLDVDTDEAMEKVCQLGLPETRTVKTHNGWHLYFLHPGPDCFVPTNCGLIWPGLDVKGENGYITAPPSPHPQGGYYCWLNPEAPVADLPPDVLKLLQAQPHRSRWKMIRRYLYRKYLRHPFNAITGL